MKNSVENDGIVGQSNNEGMKSQKHEANLQKKLIPIFSDRFDTMFIGKLCPF